jgi:hypothetical protein
VLLPVWLAAGRCSCVIVDGLGVEVACAEFSVGRAVGDVVKVELSWSTLPLFVIESADTVPAKTRIAEMTITNTTLSCVCLLVVIVFNCLAIDLAACRLMSGDFIAAPIFFVACLACFTVSFSIGIFILSLPV